MQESPLHQGLIPRCSAAGAVWVLMSSGRAELAKVNEAPAS